MVISPDVAEVIRRKKSQYGRFADTKQWHNFDKIALPDAEYSFFDTDGSVLQVGKTALAFGSTEAFRTFFTRFFANVQTLHNFGPGELEQNSPEEVKAVWSVEDQIIANGTAGLVELRGGGFYYETWRLKDGDWFLHSLKLERTYQKTSLGFKLVLILQGLGLNFF